MSFQVDSHASISSCRAATETGTLVRGAVHFMCVNNLPCLCDGVGVCNERAAGTVRHHQSAIQTSSRGHVSVLSTCHLRCHPAQDDLSPRPCFTYDPSDQLLRKLTAGSTETAGPDIDGPDSVSSCNFSQPILLLFYYAPTLSYHKQWCDTSIHRSVCLSHAPSSKNVHFKSYYRILTGNSMLEVEPTGQLDHMATENGQNGNEAVVGTTSEAFTIWLHHSYAPSNYHKLGHIVSLRDTWF